MVRQFWIYLLDDDEAEFFAAVEAAKPGAFTVGGRFVRGGDPQAVLRGELAGLEFSQLSARETHRLIFHRQASQALVAHPVLEGPLQGAHSIDVARSECLHLVRPAPVRGLLEPSRLFGDTHVMQGEDKLRKSPGFFLWLSAVHKRLKATFPRSGVDFIHVGPRAHAWATSGEGKLTYLFQPIPLEPVKAPTPMTTPQKKAPR
jgi:hypothetical protein